MELSLLLAEQILAMFLTMAVGFFVVKIGLFQETDGKVISNLVVYICSPCIIIDSFQIEMTDDKVRGLLLAVIAAIFVHIVMLAGTWILNHIFHFNSIEKASIIYTNAGYLIIPLVGAVLGSEWVFYTTAFILVQTVLMWTHCTCLISESRQKDWKKILFNPNIVAMLLGLLLFLFRVQLPGSILCQRFWTNDKSGKYAGHWYGDWKCGPEMGVYTKKTVLDLFLSADLLSDSGSYWFWNPWTDGDTSGCRIHINGCSSCNGSSGSGNGHAACTALQQRCEIRQCDQCYVSDFLYCHYAGDGYAI